MKRYSYHSTLSLVLLCLTVAVAGCSDGYGPPREFRGAPKRQAENPPVPVQEQFTQVFYNHKFDIVWMVDNSDSMIEEITSLRGTASGFMQELVKRRSLDWRMVVVNSDADDKTSGFGHGNLMKHPDSGVKVVESSSATAAADFAALLDVVNVCGAGRPPCTATSGNEQGLESAKLVLQDHSAEFLRPDANLAIVMVSDEEDVSPDLPANYVNYYRSVKTSSETSVAVHSVVGSRSGECLAVSSAGSRYLAASALTNGLSGTICEDKILTTLQTMGKLIGEAGACFRLARKLRDQSTLKVKVNGVERTSGFSYNEEINALCFDPASIPTNGSVIQVDYTA